MRDISIPEDKKSILKDLVDHKLISRDEAAKMIGVSPPQITAGIINGTLPIGTVLQGNRTVISLDRLVKWIKGCDLCSRASYGICTLDECI